MIHIAIPFQLLVIIQLYDIIASQTQCGDISDCKTCTTSNEFGCGWCPSSGTCMAGSQEGPHNGTCAATVNAGQWTFYDTDCPCITATKCEDAAGTAGGWCPYHKHCYLGDKSGPYNNITCPASADVGQWTYLTNDCKCLNAKKCTDKGNSGGGWCPSRNRCYLGDKYGPYNNISCPANYSVGQWTYFTNDCKCLNAKKCTDMDDSGGGWCPSRGRCYLGNKSGPYDNITCPATNSQGSWIYYTSNCAMLTASNCKQCNQACGSCSWCPFRGKCFYGNFNGPTVKGIDCPSDWVHGQYIYYDDHDCPVLDQNSAVSCKQCVNACPDCGWCEEVDGYGGNRCLLGDSHKPWYGLNCSKWIGSSENCNSIKCPLNCDQTVSPVCDPNTGACTLCTKGYSGKYCDSNEGVCEQCKTMESELIQKAFKLECTDATETVTEACLVATVETGPLDPFICAGVGAAMFVSCEKAMDKSIGCAACASVCPDCYGLEEIIVNNVQNYSIPSYPSWPSTFTMKGNMKTINGTTGIFYMILSHESNIMIANTTNKYGTVHYFQNNSIRYHSWCNQTMCGCQYTVGAQNVSIYDYLHVLMVHFNVSESLKLVNITEVDGNMSLVVWNGNVINNTYVQYYEYIIGSNISDPRNKRYPTEINLMYDDNTYFVQHIIDIFNDSIDDQWNLLNPRSIQNCSAALI
eukprot:179334_1